MNFLPLLFVVVAATAVFAYLLIIAGRHRAAMNRLGVNVPGSDMAGAVRLSAQSVNAQLQPYPGRWRKSPWVMAVVVGAVVWWIVGWSLVISLAIAVMVGLLASQIESSIAERRAANIERQLADAIDIMVGTLQAGGGLIAALENASQEVANPLRQHIAQMVARIRFGDRPQAVLARFSETLPMESFRLFAAALSIHWEVGGSLAPTLATVGRTVRDRIDVSRRIRSMTVQARLSTAALLFVTYLIAFLMWRKDPERMAGFLTSSAGELMVAASVVLQAIGIVWQGYLSRTRF